MSVCLFATACSDGTLEFVVDDWLRTGLNAGHVIAHRVQASLGGVHFDDGFEGSFAPVQLFSEEGALGFAFLHHERFGVFAVLEHFLDVLGTLNVGMILGFVPNPARGQKACNSASHFFLFLVLLL